MEWRVKVGEEEYIANDVEILKSWFQEGRIRPEHYVLHPVLKQWMYVRDLEELRSLAATVPPPVAKKKAGCGRTVLTVIGVVALILVFAVVLRWSPSTPNDAVSPVTTPTTAARGGPQSVPRIRVVVASKIVKAIGSQYRYFFDIRNEDSRPFQGSTEITLVNQLGSDVWNETFSTTRPVDPGLGASVHLDAHTGPAHVHGEFGIVRFKYAVTVNGQVVASGDGPLTEAYEDASRLP